MAPDDSFRKTELERVEAAGTALVMSLAGVLVLDEQQSAPEKADILVTQTAES